MSDFEIAVQRLTFWLRDHMDDKAREFIGDLTMVLLAAKESAAQQAEIERLRAERLRGYINGLKAFAWWKDGVQYVGSCGTTLREAVERAEREYVAESEVQDE